MEIALNLENRSEMAMVIEIVKKYDPNYHICESENIKKKDYDTLEEFEKEKEFFFNHPKY